MSAACRGAVRLPARVVEPIRKTSRGVVGEEQALDRRAPVERGVALAEPGEDVLGVAGRGGEPGVLEAVDAVLQADADLVLAVGVRDDRLAALLRGLDDRLDLFVVIWSWSISLMKSTPASTSFCTLARASAAPSTPQRTTSRTRRTAVLDEGARDEEARPGDLARARSAS